VGWAAGLPAAAPWQEAGQRLEGGFWLYQNEALDRAQVVAYEEWRTELTRECEATDGRCKSLRGELDRRNGEHEAFVAEIERLWEALIWSLGNLANTDPAHELVRRPVMRGTDNARGQSGRRGS
jgi:hypothetical protein